MDAPAVPDNLTPSGARRLAAAAAAAAEGLAPPLTPAAAGRAAEVAGAAPEDPVDALVEANLRKTTGAEKIYHDRMDHAAHRDAKGVEPHAKPRNKPERRPGFGSTAAAGSARSEARQSAGRAGRALHHGGAHTKAEGLQTNISADAREYEAARAGLSVSEEEEEEA